MPSAYAAWTTNVCRPRLVCRLMSGGYTAMPLSAAGCCAGPPPGAARRAATEQAKTRSIQVEFLMARKPPDVACVKRPSRCEPPASCRRGQAPPLANALLLRGHRRRLLGGLLALLL